MRENLTIINTDKAPAAVGTYSQGIEYGGVFYFSGQIGLDPQSMKLRPDFHSQLEQVLKNIDGVLEAAGLNRDNIIKTTIFMKDLENFKFVNEAYEGFFSKPYPARSCVEAARLPLDCEVEIEVIAAKG